ncbi:MAG: HAD-IA family hydrolase [Candidatus Rokubacteria bacterium]|nr:HAD-IA family hydrolase [Candidatus Rokubacteria bacterium]
MARILPRRPPRFNRALICYALCVPAPPVCVFDLDHTLVSSPLDLRAAARDMEAFLRTHRIGIPERALRWSAPELLDLARRSAPGLEAGVVEIVLAYERRAMEAAVLEPFAAEAVAAMRGLGFRTAVWTNNDRGVADHVLARFALVPHMDLVVTRTEVERLKPDPDGLRLVRARWPGAERIVLVGDSWVDGLAAQAGGVPFIAYRADHEELARRGVAVAASISSLLDLPAALAGPD